MLVRAFSKLIVFVGPLLIIGYLFSSFFGGEDSEAVQQVSQWLKDHDAGENAPLNPEVPNENALSPSDWAAPGNTLPSGPENNDLSLEVDANQAPPQEPLPPPSTLSVDSNGDAIVNYLLYREVFSVSTPDRKFFAVDFGDGFPALNPNIIPHPQESDIWIIVAQKEKLKLKDVSDYFFEEMVCNASFQPDGSLKCVQPPTSLPVAPTHGDRCTGELSYFGFNVGPHDMRVSYGPDAPYSVFGSQSAHTCFGIFAQDFRSLVGDFGLAALTVNLFKDGTELQRPPPWGVVEKNWFLFWDSQGQVYVHHDIEPRRVFAQLSADGSVGHNLAPLAASTDDACMAKYAPKPAQVNENLHQATNSLSITLCKRSDPTCYPTNDNTFILNVFHYKTFHSWHGVYEPYAMLFQQTAPFAVHAISQKPIWIHGRGPLTKDSNSVKWENSDSVPKDHSEMFYVTSMAWKTHGQTYHGHIDDVLLLGFGIEDSRAGAIDILAGDLLQDLGFCSDTASSLL